jgi:hypothetical protein
MKRHVDSDRQRRRPVRQRLRPDKDRGYRPPADRHDEPDRRDDQDDQQER